MSFVCSDTSMEALTPLLHCVVDDMLVYAFPLFRNALLQILTVWIFSLVSFLFFLVASFDGLRPLLVASHCALCSLANKLRSFVRRLAPGACVAANGGHIEHFLSFSAGLIPRTLGPCYLIFLFCLMAGFVCMVCKTKSALSRFSNAL